MSKKNQNFKINPDSQIIQSILDTFGLENLEDDRLFTKDHMKEINTVKNIELLKSKLEGRPAVEGEFNDACACASACSAGAMSFGDINEKNSEIYKLKHDKRAYHLLDGVGTKPNVVYQVKIRNEKKV